MSAKRKNYFPLTLTLTLTLILFFTCYFVYSSISSSPFFLAWSLCSSISSSFLFFAHSFRYSLTVFLYLVILFLLFRLFTHFIPLTSSTSLIFAFFFFTRSLYSFQLTQLKVHYHPIEWGVNPTYFSLWQ